MSHPSPTLDRARFCPALTAFLDQTMPACAQVNYRLVGTGAALLHGVSLPVADMDILVKERSDVDALGAALAPFPCLEPPTLLPHGMQYYANYQIAGVEVGISTVELASDVDTSETVGRGPWEHYLLLPCGHHSVPTVALELRLITELYRHRPDRSQPIIQHLQTHGCDLDFILRGVAAAGLPSALQDDLRRQLGAAPYQAIAGPAHE